MSSSECNVMVAVRLRPSQPQELRGRRCVEVTKDRVGLLIGKKIFSFDHVFEEESKQEDIYDMYVQPLVESLFSGYNGTVLAYGQTGSGKTYSIMGLPLGYEDEGVIPRALRNTFDLIKENKEKNDVATMQISFLEIYNDEVKDLLHPDIPSKDIVIREDKEGRIFFTGAREVTVSDVDSALYYLERGNLGRTTAETCMNNSSSRSHAIFTISMDIFKYNDSKDQEFGYRDGSLIQSKLHLVDLAGSERAKRTQAVGIRLKESVGINQGLLALGKVIRALTSGSQHHVHVPYRESKLTRFLQDSLGGNSRTFMLACVSPAEINLHETLSTLQYAARTRSIQNKVVANVQVEVTHVDVESNVVINLRSQLNQMQEEMDILKRNPLEPHPHASNKSEYAGNSQLASALKVVAEAQSLLELALNGLGHTYQAKDCGIAWDVVCNCKKVVQILGHILQTHGNNDQTIIVGARASLRRSLVDTIMGSAVQLEEIDSLQRQLKECREDLKRDEEIFTEKVRDLKRCRKEIQHLKGQNSELQEKLSRLALTDTKESQGTKLSRSGVIDYPSDEKTYRIDNSSEGKVESNVSGDLDLDKVCDRIEDLIMAKMNREMLAEVKQRFVATTKEREELRLELKHLKESQKDGDLAVKKQASEVEKRIGEINEQLSQHIDDSRTVDRLQRTKRNYEEYVEELLVRKASIANSDTSSRIDELKEELKILDTEIDLCESRFEELRDKDAKLDMNINVNDSYSEQGVDMANLERIKLFVEEMLASIKNNVGNNGSKKLLFYLANQLVDIKFKTRKDICERDMLQIQLNRSQADTEEIIASSNKQRGDFMKRLDQQKSESDEKIAFLLQQLKNAETRLLEMNSTSSHDINQQRRQSKSPLHEQTDRSPALENELDRLKEVNKDALKKWANEKMRRENLEEANFELIKELKSLRMKIKETPNI